MTAPQRVWHSRMATAPVNHLTRQAPLGIEVDRHITVRLDSRNRLEPDLLATTAPYDPARTFHTPEETILVVEIDRTAKLRKYAEAGITHYWRVEEEDGSPVVHAYKLDGLTGSYAPTATHRHNLRATDPFTIKLDLDGLVPGRKN